MKQTFKDLNPDAIGRLINPTRLQVSLQDMLRDGFYQSIFSSRKAAMAVTTSSKPIPGELQFIDSHFLFFCAAASLGIKNRQLLVVMFSYQNREYYVQAQTIHVYANRVELAPVAPRFYQRTLVSAPTNISLMTHAALDSFLQGQRLVRRYFQDQDEASQTFFVVRDRVRSGDKAFEDLTSFGHVTSGTMMEISQGGCSVKVNLRSNDNIRDVKMASIEASLRWGKRIGNLSTFVCLRQFEIQSPQTIILRCAFLDPLPQVVDDLSDASQEYSISCAGAKALTVNGQVYQMQKDVLALHLPLGTQLIKILWADGAEEHKKILLGNNSEKSIVLTKDVA